MEKLNDSWKKEFTERIKLIAGENEAAFAKKAGLSDQLLRKYLKGSIPGSDQLLKIAKAAACSTDWLLTGKEYEHPSCPVKCDAEMIEICKDLKEILQSDDKETIEAIKSNIIAFKKSVHKDQTIDDLDKRLSHLENIMFRDPLTDFAGGG